MKKKFKKGNIKKQNKNENKNEKKNPVKLEKSHKKIFDLFLTFVVLLLSVTRPVILENLYLCSAMYVITCNWKFQVNFDC